MTVTTATSFAITNSLTQHCGSGGFLVGRSRLGGNTPFVLSISNEKVESREEEDKMEIKCDSRFFAAEILTEPPTPVATNKIVSSVETGSKVCPSTAWYGAEALFLPDEILGKIFRFAQFPKQLSAVCKRWNEVYRRHFCYLDKRLAWVEGYRWCINFARQQNPRREREIKLRALVHKVLDGLTRLVKENSRNTKTLFENTEMAQSVFLVAASEGYPFLVNKMLEEDERIDPADDNNAALVESACRGHKEVVGDILLHDPRVDISALAEKEDPRAQIARKRAFVCNLLDEHNFVVS